MKRAAFALTAALFVSAAPPAVAQTSVVSELWREWAVLERQVRHERAEVETDRRRLQARRAARGMTDGKAKDKPPTRPASPQ